MIVERSIAQVEKCFFKKKREMFIY